MRAYYRLSTTTEKADFSVQRIIQGICTYLDRAYLLHSSKPCINEMAVLLFCTHVFQEPSLKAKIVDGACRLIAKDRNGEDVDQSLFTAAMAMFHDLGVYTKDFEPRMLELSQNFIVYWAKKAVGSFTLPQYVLEVLHFMERETCRCDLFNLFSSTKRALITLLEHHLIDRQLSFLSK